jgi:hypothetical protein
MVITGDCPHCGTKEVAFNARYQFKASSSSNEIHMLATCNACRLGVIFWLALYHHNAEADLVRAVGSQETLKIAIKAQWPNYSTSTPGNVPTNIASFYEQGLRALTAGHWDAAGAMFRKTLDVATKKLRPDFANKRLYDRIEVMVKSGDLTSAMGEWSHNIRLDGNDAIHDDEPETAGDAKGTQLFTEAFLTYSFTLPAMVDANREKRQAANDAAEAAA